ncbi:MAG: hypothetical protein ACREQA_23510 [Candidatus Binatia bacterium]
MPYKIENLTMRPVLLPLTSGQTLRLAPRETSSELRDVEVINNLKVQKLQERRVIALHDVAQQKEAPVCSEVEEREDTSARSRKKKAESTE